MPWFTVIARLAHDDEDSLFILKGEDADWALSAAEQELREEDPDDPDDTPREFYWNYVLRSETEPVIEKTNV